MILFFKNTDFSKQENNLNSELPIITNQKAENKVENEKNIGLWVSYMDLNVSGSENFQEAFKKRFDEIIEKSKKFGVNNIYAHVRPFCDSLYPSKVFPFSHLLTGKQGKDPNFDPLKYMVEASHNNNMKFHAWINPLRVKLKNLPETLADSNPYYKFKSSYFLNSENAICFNPGYEETRKLISDGAKEIAENYDVDGIHFDDYFYPESLSVKDYAFEESGEKDLISFRKKSISLLINEVYTAVKSANPKIKFGISPLGNIEKCNLAGLDVLQICKSKSVDYICPQLYWSLDYKAMPFEKAAMTWKNALKNTGVELFAGLALYKLGTDLDEGTWKNDKEILPKEIDILKNLDYKSVVLYSYSQLDFSKEEILNLSKKLTN